LAKKWVEQHFGATFSQTYLVTLLVDCLVTQKLEKMFYNALLMFSLRGEVSYITEKTYFLPTLAADVMITIFSGKMRFFSETNVRIIFLHKLAVI
jgi:hypothetical protein